MSVINQVLLDLEKRRVSGPERNALPHHVRALPEGERTAHWRWWAAGAGGLAVVAGGIAAAWVVLPGLDLTRGSPSTAVEQRPSAEAAVGKVVAARAAATAEAPAREERGRAKPDTPVSRPSVETSGPPSTVTAQSAAEASPAEAKPSKDPLPAARVIGRAGSESDARSEAQSPAARPDERAKAPTVLAAAERSASIASAKPEIQKQVRQPAPREKPAAPAARPETGETPKVVAPAKPPVNVATAKPQIKKEVRQPAPRDLAENEYRKATASLHQGRLAEAQEGFHAALSLYSEHLGARQALVGLLVEGKQFGEAERVLQEGVKLAPAQTGFVITLARLQVDRGDNSEAIETLRRGLGHAQGNPDYLAFLAALLQRQGRHEEAIEQFQAALRIKPHSGVWLLGLGMSLQTVNRAEEAQEAYRRAKATGSLNAELAAFADQRLRQLQ